MDFYDRRRYPDLRVALHHHSKPSTLLWKRIALLAELLGRCPFCFAPLVASVRTRFSLVRDIAAGLACLNTSNEENLRPNGLKWD
jgi:hypothetical protein